MLLSLIISTYQNIPALQLIFQALERQSFKDFEVVVAEDDNLSATQDFIEDAQRQYSFPIQHSRQPDKGFRKCMALNEAVKMAKCDYLVLIDGDCIPHQHFLSQHYKHRKKRTVLYGRRVMLSEQLTNHLYQHLDEKPNFSMLNLLRSRCTRLDCAMYLPMIPSGREGANTGIWGCNWSIHKKDIVAVNGFDEDYQEPGIGEDTDIEWRLVANHCDLVYVKFQAIQYHLYHPLHYTDTNDVEELMKQKKERGLIFCKNGITKSITNYELRITR
jgi:cellulose synthase/poly-beta-1,6-N-acetylglucosamine synthase-like glycosyltransferase